MRQKECLSRHVVTNWGPGASTYLKKDGLYYKHGKNCSDLTKGLQDMNQYETNSTGALVNTTPLFASVWMALFYVVRKNYTERRLSATTSTDRLLQMEEK